MMAQDPAMEEILEELRKIGVNVEELLSLNPTRKQLEDLKDGLIKLAL